eukprot:TRINITY_DN9736_c1_g1_i4.p1 TRINITY_DN9736_c1_g1~~TRINITY_DN9736_c1_g1_i4.p1  ORF type:complete len:261 (+),score=19.77 TRINITY_DN9736_c1_g1_i4:137-919(+)
MSVLVTNYSTLKCCQQRQPTCIRRQSCRGRVQHIRCQVQAPEITPISLREKLDELISLAGKATFQSKSREEEIDRVVNLFEQIDMIAQETGCNKWDKQTIQGKYVAILSTDVIRFTPDGITTLGLATFKFVNPIDTKIQVDQAYVQMNDEEYKATADYTIIDAGLEGCNEVVADVEYAVNDNKMNVQFKKVVESPRNMEQMQQWKEFFGPNNPGIIDEDGVVTVNLDKRPKGYNTVKCVTTEFIVFQGNRGSWTLLRRLQ